MEIIKILIIGWAVLGGAVAFNAVAGWLKFPSWYEYLGKKQRKYTWLDYAWLFVMYPLLLGLLVLFLSYFV